MALIDESARHTHMHSLPAWGKMPGLAKSVACCVLRVA